jgi:zinc/manganese transport system substrate-binding protein
VILSRMISVLDRQKVRFSRGSTRRATVAVSLLIAPALTSCSNEPPVANGEPSLIATTTIWAEITSRALCDSEVISIVPTGADPHTFEPSLADRATLESADLVIANGLALEEGLVDLLATVADGGTPVIEMTDAVTIREMGDDHDEHDGDHDDDHADDHDDDHDDGHSGGDPHIWLDPLNVAAVVPLIAKSGIDAGLDTSVRVCAEKYVDELEALDADITAELADISAERRYLVTNHDALGYFADRYDLEVVGTVIPSLSTLAETNPADLADLAAVIDELDIPAVFAEAQASDRDAEALADALSGVAVVTLDTGSLRDGGDTYVAMMRRNARAIATALD